MAKVTEFSPLGHLADLQGNAQLGDWNREVEKLMHGAVGAVERLVGRGNSQFFDPSKFDMGAANAVPISWKGFPLSLTAQGFTELEAFKIADGFAKDGYGQTGRDAQDEYLEWYVHRDTAGDVVQIDFTTEGPEYWQTLVANLTTDEVMALYKHYYPLATAAVVFPGGQYDIDNAFNNAQGAIHLRQGQNFLSAEVNIAALSTVTYTKGGVSLQSGADLCDDASLGVATRASDPHIAETVNGVAQAGSRVSLQDPIGLYMSAPDFTGWQTPDGSPAQALWVSERGNPTTRGSLKSGANFKLSQVKIAGQNIAWGGQVAKLIDVHLTGLVSAPGTVPTKSYPVEQLKKHQAAQSSLFDLTLGPKHRPATVTGR